MGSERRLRSGPHNSALLLVVVVFAALGIFTYFFSTVFILDSFEDLEFTDTVVGVEQVLQALSNTVDTIASKTGDWALWDEPYRFMQGANPGFPATSIYPRIFVELDINLMLFADLGGGLAFAQVYDLENEEEEYLPEGIVEQLYAESPMLTGPDGGGGNQGLLMSGTGPVLFASRQILTSGGEGPPQGYVIFGRYLDKREVARLSEQTKHSLAIFPAASQELPPDVAEAGGSLAESGEIAVRPLSTDRVVGYAMLSDVFGAPQVILRVDMPRLIYERGRDALTTFLAFFLPAVLLSLAFMVWLLLRLSSYQAALEDKARQLSVFLSVASHELRHPVTIIKGYTDLLARDPEALDGEGLAKVFDGMGKSANRLTLLTDELVDVSRIESGGLQLAVEKVDVDSVLAGVVGEMQARGFDNPFEVRVHDGGIEVHADPEMLSRLLVILLENAVKFSPTASTVEIEVCESGPEATFSVLDRGPGVPAGEAKNVFESFYQLEDTQHHSKPGMGLGLYIASRIAEAHGGRIWYEPRQGGGSAFRFALPLREN